MRTAVGGFLSDLTSAIALSPYRLQESSFRGAMRARSGHVEGITVCWCPPGRLPHGSPSSERGRRPDEAQVEVTLTRGSGPQSGSHQETVDAMMADIPGPATVR